MKSMDDICYCILDGKGLLGTYSVAPDGSHSFSPILLRSLPGAERLARRLANITKCRHAVSLYDMDSGAVFKPPENPPSSYRFLGF